MRSAFALRTVSENCRRRISAQPELVVNETLV